MSIVVIGATGKLGRATIDALLERGVAPTDVVAAGRNAERLAEHATKGVRTAVVDVDDAASVVAALEGARRVMLVSIPGNPRRVEQHTTVIDAARAAGVELVAYTSFLHADVNPGHADHVATEAVLRDSGVPFAVLRDGVYFTYFTRQLPTWREDGRIVGSAASGRISAASHRDLGAAAATILTTDGHAGSVYELGVDDSFTMADVAAAVGRATGTDISYVDVPTEEHVARLVAAGNAEALAERMAETDRSIAAGGFFTDTGDLARLVGRPLDSLDGMIAAAL